MLRTIALLRTGSLWRRATPARSMPPADRQASEAPLSGAVSRFFDRL
jgi:hypothetical protein